MIRQTAKCADCDGFAVLDKDTCLRHSTDDSVSRSLLKERIETKIEEYRESAASNGFDMDTYPAGFEDGTIQGLKLALYILEES